MRSAGFLLIGLLVTSSLSCDGHARLLYLQRPDLEKPPWSIASTTILISGNEDVPRLAKAVATKLGLAYDSGSTGYTAAVNDHGGSFTMIASQETNGRWVIRLIDWPSFTRSQYSTEAEQEIRKALSSGAYGGGHRSASEPAA